MQADERDRLCAALADHYAIERELGHGGMAIVYLARDVKHDRPVALKVLRPELAASLGTERFLREINLAARLTHPHILPLHHSGEAAGFRSEEHTSESSHSQISYAVFCLKKKKTNTSPSPIRTCCVSQ